MRQIRLTKKGHYLVAYPSNRKQHKYSKGIRKLPVELKFGHASPHLHAKETGQGRATEESVAVSSTEKQILWYSTNHLVIQGQKFEECAKRVRLRIFSQRTNQLIEASPTAFSKLTH